MPTAARSGGDTAHIKFAPEPQRGNEKKGLYIPGPRELETGKHECYGLHDLKLIQGVGRREPVVSGGELTSNDCKSCSTDNHR